VRLLYLHVPCAWLAYLAFGVTALASLLWLIPRTRSATWDLLAGASAEVGVIFTALMLVVGSLWGRPTWGTWWEWDARLTTTAILFFLYLGYLALRRTGATADERGTRCAIAALIAFADVPIVHFSVSWWQTLHQKGTVFNEKLDVKVNGSMAARRRSRGARVARGNRRTTAYRAGGPGVNHNWNYVIVGYSLVGATLTSYAVWLRIRIRRLRKTLSEDARD